MNNILITSNNYIPNIRILKNHIITFNDYFIYLYNIKGNLLASIKIDSENEIKYIFYIHNNFLIGFTSFDLFKIIIKDESVVIFQKKEEELFGIDDILYLKKNKIFIILNKNCIYIKDINFVNIQIINIQYSFYKQYLFFINLFSFYKQYSFLFNINEELFILFNENSISLYQKKTGIKYYQLLTKKNLSINLDTYNRRLLKLDNKIVMVSTDDILYLINIKSMKICKGYYFLFQTGKIDFIYKIKDSIYIHKECILLEFKYCQNHLTLIKSININALFSFNYVINIFIEQKYPKLYNKIKINCIKNKIIPQKKKYSIMKIYSEITNQKKQLLKAPYNKVKIKRILKNNIINKHIKINKSKLIIEKIQKKKKNKYEIKKNKSFYSSKFKKNYR